MFASIKDTLFKKKFQHFLYTHVLFLAGMIWFDIILSEFLLSLLYFIVVVAPFFAVIAHLKFNHNYIDFKNSFNEWCGLVFMTVYSFWKFKDLKSYHILHHKNYNTDQDPTYSEIQQGRINYYIGLVDPTAIPTVKVVESQKIAFINTYFYAIKISIYFAIALIFSFKALFLFVFAQQFYYYVYSKCHEILFHGSLQARDLPIFFPIFFNNAWHVEHHTKYDELDPWHWPFVNLHFWYYKLFFKKV